MASSKQQTSKASSRLYKIERFYRERIPVYRDTPNFRRWLEWADALGCLLAVFPDEREESPLAVAIVRPIRVSQLAAGYDSFAFDEQGEVLFLDNVIAPNKNLIRALLIGALQRFGPRLAIAYDTHGSGIRVRNFNQTRKALLRT